MLSTLLDKGKTVQRVEKSFGSKFDSVRLENSLKRTNILIPIEYLGNCKHVLFHEPLCFKQSQNLTLDWYKRSLFISFSF